MNVVEVSVVLIGTPKALRLFSNEFRQARRASGEGSIVWDRMACDENWDNFLEELFKYQWLKTRTELDESLSYLLYDLSQGIPDIVVKLFCIAQARAILLARSSNEECISAGLFNDVFEEEFSIVKPMLDALKKNDKTALLNCSDIVIPSIESELMNGFDHLKAIPLKKKRIEIGDASQSNIANSAIETLLSLGISQDIATPLVRDCIASNEEVELIDIIQQVTTAFATVKSEQSNKKAIKNNTLHEPKAKLIRTKSDDWGQLKNSDLRKVYSSKSETMYDALLEQGYIYPISELLAG